MIFFVDADLSKTNCSTQLLHCYCTMFSSFEITHFSEMKIEDGKIEKIQIQDKNGRVINGKRKNNKIFLYYNYKHVSTYTLQHFIFIMSIQRG